MKTTFLRNFLILSILTSLTFANTTFAQQTPAAAMFEILGNCGYKIGMAVKDSEKPETIRKSGKPEAVIQEEIAQFNIVVTDQVKRCYMMNSQIYHQLNKVYFTYRNVQGITEIVTGCSNASKDPVFVDMKKWLQCLVKATSKLKLPETKTE